MSFFKIPPGLASQIGYIEYAPGKAIHATGKQKDNTYLLKETLIDEIKVNQSAILNYVPQGLRQRILHVINLDKGAHTRITKEQADEGAVKYDRHGNEIQ